MDDHNHNRHRRLYPPSKGDLTMFHHFERWGHSALAVLAAGFVLWLILTTGV